MLRRIHTSTIRTGIKPAFKPHNPKSGIKTFEDNFQTSENNKGEKIWDRLNISKDEFFGRKYGNITPETRKKLDEKVARQRRYRELRKQHELGDLYMPKSEPVDINPVAEYVFGTHPVILALTARKRRSFSRLFIFNQREHTSKIVQMAKNLGIRIVEKYSKADMNRLSSNGVHNGVVLETTPIHKPLLLDVPKYDGDSGVYTVNTVDENGKTREFQQNIARKNGKHPLGLYLDGITDPMNLGNIMRSAYFLGVDFVVVAERDSGRLGPVAAKASAGALDLMTIYRAGDTMLLMDKLRKNGWNVVSTLARPSEEELSRMKENQAQHIQNRFIEPSDLLDLLDSSPMMMIVGSEGEGININLKMKSDYLVGLDKITNRDPEGIVDSLNVGIATGLLISRALD